MIRTLLFCAMFGFAVSAAAAPKPVTLMLDWYKNPNHAPILLAAARGDYAKAGLDVTVQEPADPNAPPKLAAAGKIDLAIGYQPQAMILIDKGVPVARAGALVATPLNSVMVMADGPVKSLANLKGRKVGYSVSGFEGALLGAMLEGANLKARDVTMINVNFSLAPSLLSGQVDAVIGAFRNYETHQMVLKGKAVRTFPVEAFGVPAYEELIFLTARDRANDPTIQAFLEATAKAAAAIKQNPQGAWTMIIASEKNFDNELNRRAYADTAKLFADPTAKADPASIDKFGAFLKARGITRAPITHKQYQPE
jgi:putative hydroxymethylpyrimidine transport system substrate-binding protein